MNKRRRINAAEQRIFTYFAHEEMKSSQHVELFKYLEIYSKGTNNKTLLGHAQVAYFAKKVERLKELKRMCLAEDLVKSYENVPPMSPLSVVIYELASHLVSGYWPLVENYLEEKADILQHNLNLRVWLLNNGVVNKDLYNPKYMHHF